MKVETKANLNESTIAGLQKLIQYNTDAFNGFREAAEDINNLRVQTLFRELANERSDLARELQNYVHCNGEEAEQDGSMMAAVHRAWIKVRSVINGEKVFPVLCEAERGEDHIKAAYEEVLKDTAGSAVNDVLTRQYAIVKAGHDRVRNMRDSFKDS